MVRPFVLSDVTLGESVFTPKRDRMPNYGRNYGGEKEILGGTMGSISVAVAPVRRATPATPPDRTRCVSCHPPTVASARPARSRQGDPLGRDGRPEHVAADSLEPIALPRRESTHTGFIADSIC